MRSDPVRLRQCLFNLLSNALKFTSQGHVFLRVTAEQKDGRSFIRCAVEDTGIGIPEDKQKSIFEAFSQVDGSMTREYGGTGLGLAITMELTLLLGGQISLESEIGKGSVFSVTVPVVLPSENAILDKSGKSNKNTVPKGPVPQSGTVLVADDNKTSEVLVTLLLEKLGFEVTAVSDGAEAVDEALTKSFDLILMDMQMPSVDGYEATKILRDKGVTSPIVAVTAYALEGDRDKCISAGCDDYISKPINKDRLYEIVGKHVQRLDISAEFVTGQALAKAGSAIQ
jgi:CheY-like chemotaxis protein